MIAHGTDNQKARLGADMLPQAEVLDCIRAQVYAPLEGEPRYTKLSDEDVCQGTGYDDGYHDVDFSVEDATDLSADEWDRLCNLRERMPDATITVRRHIGQCNECEERAVRTSYHVAMQVGEFEFSREYGEPESDPE